MSYRSTATEVKEIYESAIEHLYKRYSAGEIAQFSAGKYTGRFKCDALGQKPERYVEEWMVWPLLRSLGYPYRTEVYCPSQNVFADLELELPNSEVIHGEVKPFGRLKEARWTIVRNIGSDTFSNSVGFATTGVQWWLFDQDLDIKIKAPEEVASFNFRAFILNYLKEVDSIDLRKHRVSQRSVKQLNRQKEAERFVKIFDPHSVQDSIS